MDLYRQILVKALENEKIEITFPSLGKAPEELVEMRCYAALRRIKEILDDEALEDRDCYEKIERIIQTFEDLGSGCGVRHDFG